MLRPNASYASVGAPGVRGMAEDSGARPDPAYRSIDPVSSTSNREVDSKAQPFRLPRHLINRPPVTPIPAGRRVLTEEHIVAWDGWPNAISKI